jgi:hypothetical protein
MDPLQLFDAMKSIYPDITKIENCLYIPIPSPDSLTIIVDQTETTMSYTKNLFSENFKSRDEWSETFKDLDIPSAINVIAKAINRIKLDELNETALEDVWCKEFGTRNVIHDL